jgi:hypothetical protein
MHHRFVRFGLGAVAVSALASASSAALIVPGFYTLNNHPDGSLNPPPYGARFDELYDATPDHDSFTLNFDHPSSDAELFYDGSVIIISGNSYGGRDVGSVYANDAYLGDYQFYFAYTVGVEPVPGDDDIRVNAPNASNFGWIRTPLGDVISLTDEVSGGYSFRFGDEDDDLGHRGHPGISGWGWMTHHWETQGHIAATDWIFTATFDRNVPAPMGVGLVGLAGLLAGRRRR